MTTRDSSPYPYVAPLQDMRFALRELVDLEGVLARQSEALSADVVDAVLEEAARFATGVLSPSDAAGDRETSRWSSEGVQAPASFRAAYRQFVDAGWHALACSPAYGGQGMPRILSALVEEMWHGASLTLMGCFALTSGAIEALMLRAPEPLRRLYLPPLVAGRWTGTMNLTEPQAGSDLSALAARAVPHADGSWRVRGQKIFITWGEHDMAENIVHLVLARTHYAPPGVKGISMFLVPRRLPREDGSLGEHNRVRCLSLEHKLGQHGGATATMLYGDDGSSDAGGAVGWLIGERHRGLETMFIMMNQARFHVGLEGLAIAERAYQTARAYARERVQGVEAGSASSERVAIIRHPDVRRMLMRMRANTEAMRSLAMTLAALMDEVHLAEDEAPQARALLDLLTPVLKGWNSETAQLVTTLGVQIHGGMGFMHETRAAQHWRDARILPIYEGTTGIQASDLVGRKIARDGGAAARRLVALMEVTVRDLGDAPQAELRAIGNAVDQAIAAVSTCVEFVVHQFDVQPRLVLAVSVPLLHLIGLASAGWQMGRAALAAQRRLNQGGGDDGFLRAKIVTARFFTVHEMTAIEGLVRQVLDGGESALALPEDRL